MNQEEIQTAIEIQSMMKQMQSCKSVCKYLAQMSDTVGIKETMKYIKYMAKKEITPALAAEFMQRHKQELDKLK